VLALRWTERAVAHLEGIVDYVALTSPVYADAILLRIEHRLALAQAHPYLGKVPRETTDLSIRELVVAPYRWLLLQADRRGLVTHWCLVRLAAASNVMPLKTDDGG
jgi:plasmid stabilization system protein ParE